jgi:tetratricopeptide (TPR) repeat protein
MCFNLSSHSYDDAEDEYRAALRANESFEWAHNNLGLMLMNVRGDYDGAEKEFRRAIDLDPTYTWARNNLGLLLYEVGRWVHRSCFCRIFFGGGRGMVAHTSIDSGVTCSCKRVSDILLPILLP